MVQALDPEKCRGELEELLCKWRDLEEGSPDEQATALDTWHKYEQLTSAHSQQLCEQLRIVLEPSIANKLRYVFRFRVLPLGLYVCINSRWRLRLKSAGTFKSEFTLFRSNATFETM